MPTYEYKCDACGHDFEQFHSITAEPIRKCPKCGKMKVKRLIGTGAGLIFKGSGFYITDYRDQGYKDKAKADSGTSTEAASDKAKSDTASSNGDGAKPAAAEEKKPADAKPAAAAKPETKRKKKH
jgi:putative FmdB family regulatory protein